MLLQQRGNTDYRKVIDSHDWKRSIPGAVPSVLLSLYRSGHWASVVATKKAAQSNGRISSRALQARGQPGANMLGCRFVSHTVSWRPVAPLRSRFATERESRLLDLYFPDTTISVPCLILFSRRMKKEGFLLKLMVVVRSLCHLNAFCQRFVYSGRRVSAFCTGCGDR